MRGRLFLRWPCCRCCCTTVEKFANLASGWWRRWKSTWTWIRRSHSQSGWRWPACYVHTSMHRRGRKRFHCDTKAYHAAHSPPFTGHSRTQCPFSRWKPFQARSIFPLRHDPTVSQNQHIHSWCHLVALNSAPTSVSLLSRFHIIEPAPSRSLLVQTCEAFPHQVCCTRWCSQSPYPSSQGTPSKGLPTLTGFWIFSIWSSTGAPYSSSSLCTCSNQSQLPPCLHWSKFHNLLLLTLLRHYHSHRFR